MLNFRKFATFAFGKRTSQTVRFDSLETWW